MRNSKKHDALFLIFQPTELGKFVTLLEIRRTFFAAIPNENVNILFDVYVVAEPLTIRWGC